MDWLFSLENWVEKAIGSILISFAFRILWIKYIRFRARFMKICDTISGLPEWTKDVNERLGALKEQNEREHGELGEEIKSLKKDVKEIKDSLPINPT